LAYLVHAGLVRHAHATGQRQVNGTHHEALWEVGGFELLARDGGVAGKRLRVSEMHRSERLDLTWTKSTKDSTTEVKKTFSRRVFEDFIAAK
jgi:hypothetical protein